MAETLQELQGRLESVFPAEDMPEVIASSVDSEVTQEKLAQAARSEAGVKLLTIAADNGIGGLFNRTSVTIPAGEIQQLAQQFGVTAQNIQTLLFKTTEFSRETAESAIAVSSNTFPAKVHLSDGTVLWDPQMKMPNSVANKAKKLNEAKLQEHFEAGLIAGMEIDVPANGKVSDATLMKLAKQQLKDEQGIGTKLGHGAQHTMATLAGATAAAGGGLLGGAAGFAAGMVFGIPRALINAVRHKGAKADYRAARHELALAGDIEGAQKAEAAAMGVQKGVAGFAFKSTAAVALGLGATAEEVGRRGANRIFGGHTRNIIQDDAVMGRVAGMRASIEARGGKVFAEIPEPAVAAEAEVIPPTEAPPITQSATTVSYSPTELSETVAQQDASTLSAAGYAQAQEYQAGNSSEQLSTIGPIELGKKIQIILAAPESERAQIIEREFAPQEGESKKPVSIDLASVQIISVDGSTKPFPEARRQDAFAILPEKPKLSQQAVKDQLDVMRKYGGKDVELVTVMDSDGKPHMAFAGVSDRQASAYSAYAAAADANPQVIVGKETGAAGVANITAPPALSHEGLAAALDSGAANGGSHPEMLDPAAYAQRVMDIIGKDKVLAGKIAEQVVARIGNPSTLPSVVPEDKASGIAR